MAYIGKIKDRLELQVTVKGVFEYTKPSFTGYGTDYHKIYIMESEEGDTFKWDTTNYMLFDTKEDDKWGCRIYKEIIKGDVVTIKGTVKDHKEYNEVEQTVLNRVVVTSIIHKELSFEEKQSIIAKEKEQKKQEQNDSIGKNDLVWRIPYRQYKKHYSDCEIVIDSYECDNYGEKTLEIIIREGRLKNSGVRGKRFHQFLFEDEIGHEYGCKAVDLDHAFARCYKENEKGHIWIFKSQF